MGFPLENSKQKTTSNTPREITGESAKKKKPSIYYIIQTVGARYHITYIMFHMGVSLKWGYP